MVSKKCPIVVICQYIEMSYQLGKLPNELTNQKESFFFQFTVHCKIAEATCSSVCCAQFLKGLLVLLFSVPGKVKFIVNLEIPFVERNVLY